MLYFCGLLKMGDYLGAMVGHAGRLFRKAGRRPMLLIGAGEGWGWIGA